MKNKKLVIYSASFCLPILLLLICNFVLHIFPFGDQSFLYWDTEVQYVNYLSYWKSIFSTNNNFFYSFANLGGNNMLDFSAYYNYFNPLNLILFLFPDKYLNIAVETILLVKVGLCGLMFSYFLNKEVKESYFSIIFALSYALSMHTLVLTLSSIILLDGLFLLPLMMLGVSKIAEKNDYKLYLVSVFMSVLTNAYMGYVNILFSFIYFVYKLILNNFENIKQRLKPIIIYIFSSIIAIGLNAWLLLPTKYSLSTGKYAYFDILDRLFLIRENILEIISKFYTCNLMVEFWQEPAPYLFVGILILILLILYFFNSAYSKKERILDFIIFVFLFTSFFLNCLFVLWSMGVEHPNGTIYRFGYAFTFFIIFLAYKEFLNISSTKLKDIIIAGILYTVISVIIYLQEFSTLNNTTLIIDIIYGLFILIIIELFNINKIRNIKVISVVLLVAMHFVNMQVHTNNVFSSQRSCCQSPDIKHFIEHKTDMKAALKEIYKNDKGFFRIASPETFIQRADNIIYNNSQFLNQYDSFTGYSSLGPVSTRDFYYHIGVPVFTYNMLFTYSDDIETYPVSLLGTKYIITSNRNLHEPYEKMSDIGNDLVIYKNSYSFPIAFIIDNNVNLYDNLYARYPDIPNFQNNLMKVLFNQDLGNVFEYKSFDLFEKTIEYLKNNDFTNSIQISYTEQPKSNGNVYLMMNSLIAQGAHIKLIEITDKDKSFHYDVNDLNSQFIYLGNNLENTAININYIAPYNTEQSRSTIEQIQYIYSYLISENLDNLYKYSQIANNNKCELTKLSSSHLKGNLDVKGFDKLLFMSIPYDEGWKIKVNGKQRKAIRLFSAMTAVPVSEGDSVIEMNYVPKGFFPGLIISIICLLILIATVLFSRYKATKQ